jgi:prolyl 4-hydroxylase
VEADYRIRIGAEVKARLERQEGASKIPSYDLDIFIVRDFLGPADCETLVATIDAHRIPSKLLAPTADPEFRTSESCNLDPKDPFVRRIEGKIAKLLGIDLARGETIQGQRYAAGQRFKLHHDFFERGQPYWEEMERCGGQRTWTAMIFLNEVGAGGETAFPKAGIKVAPRRGNMLVWNNLNIIGEPNYFSLHEGTPVTAGTKYIITKWHRERPWSYSETVIY